MVTNFGQSIHYELKANVDVTVWEVGTVDTGIHLKGEKGAPTPKAVVADVLTQIGKEKLTTGSLRFALK